MKRWLIPAFVLLAIGGAGVGAGWFANEWQDGGELAPVPTATEQTGPTQADLDAQRREDDRLCLEAQQANAAAQGAYDAQVQRKVEELVAGGMDIRRANITAPILMSVLGEGGGVPQEVRQAIDRYCH